MSTTRRSRRQACCEPAIQVPSSQRANGIRLPSRACDAPPSPIVALPACAAAIWAPAPHSARTAARGASLRRPLARAPDAAARRDRHLRRLQRRPLAARPRPARSSPTSALLGIYLAMRARLRQPASSTTSTACSPLAKLAAQVAAAGDRARDRHARAARPQRGVGDAIALVWLVGVTNAFNLLDNMDGLAATLAAIAFGFFARRRGHRPPSRPILAFALAGALGVRRVPAVQPAPRRAGARVHGRLRQPDARLRARRARARRELARRRNDRRHARAADPRSWRCRSSTPRSSRSLRLLDGRPIYQGGRDHASHRLVRYGLSERHAVALLALIATRHRRLEPRLQRARQLRSRSSASSAPSRCSSSSRASSPTSSGGRSAGSEPIGFCAGVRASTGAAWSRCSSTSS